MKNKQLKVDHRGLEQRSLQNMSFPFRVCGSYISNYIGRRFCSHWHEDPEFTVVLEGEMFYQVNERIMKLSAGQGIFVNSNMLHSGWNENEECHYLTVNFYPTVLFCGSSEIKEKYADPIIKSQSLQYLYFDPITSNTHKQIIENLRKMGEAYLAKSELYELKMEQLLLFIWELMFPEAIQAAVADNDHTLLRQITRVKEAIDYMETHYSDHISLDDLASVCGLSQSEFCRCFKRITQNTPMEYLARTRIRKSLPLLASRKHTVTEVAFLCGFSGSSYFAECFKKYMFCTPMEYPK